MLIILVLKQYETTNHTFIEVNVNTSRVEKPVLIVYGIFKHFNIFTSKIGFDISKIYQNETFVL